MTAPMFISAKPQLRPWEQGVTRHISDHATGRFRLWSDVRTQVSRTIR